MEHLTKYNVTREPSPCHIGMIQEKRLPTLQIAIEDSMIAF